MAEVFISYARDDFEFAKKLYDALIGKRSVWMDLSDIPPATRFQPEMLAGIEQSDNFLFLISSDSAASPMCKIEIDHAVAKNKRLIAIVCRSVLRENLHPAIAEINWIDPPNRDSDLILQRLITAIDTDPEWVRQHTRFGLRAAQWEANGRDSGFLLHGTELREAIRWLEQAATIKSRQPTEAHEQYIRASEEWEAGELE